MPEPSYELSTNLSELESISSSVFGVLESINVAVGVTVPAIELPNFLVTEKAASEELSEEEEED